MTAVFDHAPARVPGPAGAGAHPDDAVSGSSRLLLIDRANPCAAFNARFAAAAAGWDWGLPGEAVDDLVAVVDALVSNAVIHAKWPDGWPVVPVTLGLLGPRVVVEVRDPDPTLPVWPTARPMDIAALIDDPDTDPDDPVLTHRQGLVDVAGRGVLSAYAEAVGKCVRTELTAVSNRGAS